MSCTAQLMVVKHNSTPEELLCGMINPVKMVFAERKNCNYRNNLVFLRK